MSWVAICEPPPGAQVFQQVRFSELPCPYHQNVLISLHVVHVYGDKVADFAGCSRCVMRLLSKAPRPHVLK